MSDPNFPTDAQTIHDFEPRADNVDQLSVIKVLFLLLRVIGNQLLSFFSIWTTTPGDITRLANATEAANASKKPSARLKVEAPDDFNGKPMSIESFIRSLEFYYLSAGGELTDREKVVYALSKIKGTEACDNWRDLIYQEIASLDGETGTWAEFTEKFRKGFTHIPNAEKAKNELQKISQGKNTAEEYVTRFKAIAMVSGLDYATWIMFFKKGLTGNLRDKIYNSEIVPGNDTKAHFEEWCKKACLLDYNWRLARADWGNANNSTSSGNHGTQKERTATVPKPKITRDPNAMDIDQAKREGRCFGCGEKGHLNRDCPKKEKRFNVRITDWTKEERELIMKQLQDFQEGQE